MKHLILLAIAFSLVAGADADGIAGRDAVQIVQPDAEGNFKQVSKLRPNDFTILIKLLHPIEAVSVFASTEDIDLSQFRFPIVREKFPYFSPGGGLAQSQDSPKSGLGMAINKIGTFNIYFSSALKYGSLGTEIHFESISDTFNRLAQSKRIYFLVYVELNDDKTVSFDELNIVSLPIENTSGLGTKKTKNYRFSSGQAIGPYKSLTTTRYVYFHIRNVEEAERYKKFIVDNIGDYPRFYRSEIVNDYSKSNYHVVLSPMSDHEKTYQPYNYNGENELVFEIVSEKYEDPGFYIYLRSVEIDKKIDDFRVVVEKNGELMELNEE